MLHEFCEEKKGVVVKEFRLDKPEQLYNLVDDTGVDLKIIRLIRDPRSMLVSRIGLKTALKIISNFLKTKMKTKNGKSLHKSGENRANIPRLRKKPGFLH